MATTDLDAGAVFSGKASGVSVKGFDTATPCTPHTDSSYQFSEASRDVIVWFLMEHPDPLYLCGPTGCGKTSLLRQLAARLNYPVYDVTGHERFEFSDLVGHLSLRGGSMAFEDGPLTLAMRNGGLMLLNEIDLCSPATLAGLNGILDGSPLCIAENNGEIVTPHPMFRFACTANTNGGMDETGLYQGALRQNLAFLDRFVMVELGYPAPQVEKHLLAQLYPAIPEDVASRMVAFAGEVRMLFMGENSSHGAIEVTLSTRTLLRWADLTIRFQPLSRQGITPITYALDRALGFRASRETRALLHELAQRHFNTNE